MKKILSAFLLCIVLLFCGCEDEINNTSNISKEETIILKTPTPEYNPYENKIIWEAIKYAKCYEIQINDNPTIQITENHIDTSNWTAGTYSISIKPIGINSKYKSDEIKKHTIKIKNYIVTLDHNGPITKIVCRSGKTIDEPQDPQKENYIFLGWYKDKYYSEEFDFSTPITENTTIYAKFTLDSTKIINKITTSTINSIFTIYNENYNTQKIFGIDTDIITESETCQGSGVVIANDYGFYYVLTNCHVAKLKEGYEKQRITIEDSKGRSYTGTIMSISAEYDLACILFCEKSIYYQPIKLAKINATLNQDVIALGSPKGQQNSITFGKATKYTSIEIPTAKKYLSNVTFNVLQNTALTTNGLSGGPLLNSNFEIVGIIYACGKEEPFSDYSFAIPVEKVKEFLSKYTEINKLIK